MRLVLTVERYAPAIGGAERVVQRIAEHLARRGHDVHVITGGAGLTEQRDGVTVHRLPISGNAVRGVRGPAHELLQTIDRVRPDLVFNYAAQAWPTDCCFELLERADRPAMVLAPCGFSGLRNPRYREYFRQMPARLRAYDAVVLHSAVYQDWDFTVAAGVERPHVIPNGADSPSERSEHEHADDVALAVTVGSHVRSKGHADFAKAIRRLSRGRRLRGAIVAPRRHGLGAIRGCGVACATRAATSRGRLSIIDGTPAGAASQAIAQADLFLFTSRIECAPLVILEAMAAGKPWVSYDVGNVRELPGGIVASDQRALLQAAGQILDGRHPDLGAEGRAAWEASHRWPIVVDRYESLFADVLGAVAAPAA